jgi:hypothetical protein
LKRKEQAKPFLSRTEHQLSELFLRRRAMKLQSILIVAMVILLAGPVPFWYGVGAAGRVEGNSPKYALRCYWEGSGTEDDPYQITTAEDMNQIGADPEYWDKHFIVVADINLSDYTGTQFNIIGHYGNPFTGIFDGNDHIISNFRYASTETDYVGLFRCLGSEGQIKNVAMEDVNVDGGSGVFIGGLAGYNNGGWIENCSAAGEVSGSDQYIGGLVGFNGGTILNCHWVGSVS